MYMIICALCVLYEFMNNQLVFKYSKGIQTSLLAIPLSGGPQHAQSMSHLGQVT